MSRSGQGCWWLVFLLAVPGLAAPLTALSAPERSPLAQATELAPTKHPPAAYRKSPVGFFRELLAMTPEERNKFLTNRPPEIRGRILAKIAQYEAMNPNDRELRLRATELRWYLIPLFREPATNRAALLAQVPADMQELVQDRLTEWSLLPPPMQQEFLENEHVLQYFAQVDAGPGPPETPGREPNAAERAHWYALSDTERRQITAGFNHFFELTPEEKQSALGTLSDAERSQMEKTLRSFEQMPQAQRAECVGAFARFASMTSSEQAEFLKNAQRWSAMSPAERQAWRDLVVNIPQWPPLPPGLVTPIPGEPLTGRATNRD